MFVTHSFRIPYDPLIYEQLRTMQREAASVWNDIVREATSYFFTYKKWLNKFDIQAVRKGSYNLHSQTVQAIVDKYDANRQTTRKLRKTDKEIKYPWKEKYYYCIPLKQASMDISDETIGIKRAEYRLSLVDFVTKKRKKNWNEKFPKRNEQVIIPNLAKEPLTNCKYAEIVWKNGSYWFHYSIEVQEKDLSSLPLCPAGVDLGEIHAVTVATENKALVVSGRAMRSISQFRAKVLADLQKKMSRCKKGSRQWKKYNAAKKRIRQKCNHQLEDLEHKTTKEVILFLEKENVTNLVIGRVSGIEKNTKKDKKKKSKTTKVRRQQLSLWNQGKIKQKLTYKAELKGIKVEETEESYTSQTCPFCHGRHKTNGRQFKCSVRQTEIHRDVNGAQNIARKKYPMEVNSRLEVVFKQPVWYKRYVNGNPYFLTGQDRHQSELKSIARRMA